MSDNTTKITSNSVAKAPGMLTYKAKQFLRRHLRDAVKWGLGLPDKGKLALARTTYKITGSGYDPRALYPPDRIALRTADWFGKSGAALGATYIPLDDAYIYRNATPKTIHPLQRRQLMMDMDYVQDETFTLVIPGGTVWADGHIFTPDGVILSDISVDFRHLHGIHASRHLWKLQKIRKIEGTVAVLATDGAKLYYHWIYQLLPRFELIRRCGIDVSSINYFLVNKLEAGFQRESLKLLGIKDSQIIETSGDTLFTADKFIVPSIPLGAGCFPDWMCEFLRQLFIPAEVQNLNNRSKRIYITRRKAGYRRVLNETAVAEFVTQRGFEIVEFENLTVRQQAKLMAEADVVLAPHGGGLTNLMFCAPGTKVIEVFSPELVAGYFWKVCSRLKLDYYYLLGAGAPETRKVDYPQSWDARSDITIDLDELEKTLALAGVK